MSEKRRYKKFIPRQSAFSRDFATWARNHRGWAKMKKANRRLAKRRYDREMEVNT